MTEFDFSAGALCLDFANTWGNRGDIMTDSLEAFSDLTKWVADAGVLDRDGLADLHALVSGAENADHLLRSAKFLREAIFSACAAAASESPPSPSDLDQLNRVLASTPVRLLGQGDRCCRWVWPKTATAFDRAMWPIVESASDILTSDDVVRIRVCAAPDCSWLFLDRSRGRRRKWCDMSTCGNRAKARRYYERHRKSD